MKELRRATAPRKCIHSLNSVILWLNILGNIGFLTVSDPATESDEGDPADVATVYLLDVPNATDLFFILSFCGHKEILQMNQIELVLFFMSYVHLTCEGSSKLIANTVSLIDIPCGTSTKSTCIALSSTYTIIFAI